MSTFVAKNLEVKVEGEYYIEQNVKCEIQKDNSGENVNSVGSN